MEKMTFYETINIAGKEIHHDPQIPGTIPRAGIQEDRIRVAVCCFFEQSAMYFSILIRHGAQRSLVVLVALFIRSVNSSPKPANAVFQELNAGEDPHGYERDCKCR